MRVRSLGFGILLIAVASVSAMAQDADPPSRVGRLNYLSGPVSFRPGTVDEWTAATLNYPLTTGDHLWVDADARAEMHIGSAAIRMDSSTAVSILNLDDAVAQLSLTEGTINVRVQYLDEGQTFEVDTPNSALLLTHAGDYRISTHGDDNLVTMAAVRTGDLDIRAGGDEFMLATGQSIQLIGLDTVTQRMGSLAPPDEFDQWCATRARREFNVASARYVPHETIGYEDLDEYGAWHMDVRYGWVWTPRVEAGWAPYHYGHWAWVEPWGWTWIDDAPWGFAPFHYGRWAFADAGWVWVPGRMDVPGIRPVYAPALVVFAGGGEFGVGAALGGGGGMAAWFALGPGEVYRPSYHVSATYVTNINIVHVRSVTTINEVDVTRVRYVNQAVPGAMVVVPHDAFVQSRRAADVAVVVPHEQIVRARVIGTAAPITPVRESVMGRARGAEVVRVPPQRLVTRQVVVSHQPPPPPVSFASKERALQSNGGRPLDPAQTNSLRRNAPDRNPTVKLAPAPAGGVRRLEQTRPAPAPQPVVRPNETRPAPAPQPAAEPVPQRPAAAPAAQPPAPKAEEKKAPPKKSNDQTRKK